MSTMTTALPNTNGAVNTGLEVETSYTFNKTTFIVTPVFGQNKKETLGEILLKLMKSDVDQA